MFGHLKGSFTDATADKVGLFEEASGGTIFMDEVGSMPLSIQGKLLRALQEKEIRRVGSNDSIAIDAATSLFTVGPKAKPVLEAIRSVDKSKLRYGGAAIDHVLNKAE